MQLSGRSVFSMSSPLHASDRQGTTDGAGKMGPSPVTLREARHHEVGALELALSEAIAFMSLLNARTASPSAR